MTRAEVKNQIERGWLNNLTAMAFLGSNFSEFEEMVQEGTLASKLDHGGRLVRLGDVLAVAQVTPKEVLDRHWPVNKQKKPARKQRVNPLTTQTERDAFQRRWFSLHRHVSFLISKPEEDFRFGELRLIHQLMNLSYRVDTFELILTAEQLEKATGLDDEALPKARRSLEQRDMLSTTRDGTQWVYTLLNHRTGQPFENPLTDDDLVITPHNSWADFSD